MKPKFGEGSKYKDIKHVIRHLQATDLDAQLNRNVMICKVWMAVDEVDLTDRQIGDIARATPAETILRTCRGKH